MPGHDIIVIGASAGGVSALTRIVHDLPKDLPASIFVVVHVLPDSASALPEILSRAGNLPARHARDREPIVQGRIYVAPPDFNLVVRRGHVRVIRGPRHHGRRPSVDPLFTSAARAYGRRLLAIVLSGNLDDGTYGLILVKSRGGMTMVQDPNDSEYPGMPRSALEAVEVDAVVPLAGIGREIVRLVHAPIDDLEEPEQEEEQMDELEFELEFIEQERASYEVGNKEQSATFISCPECGGSLWEQRESGLLHFRCHVGHAYSTQSLLMGQSDKVEGALWNAIRLLEERAALLRRLHSRAGRRGHSRAEARFEKSAEVTERQADLIRTLIGARWIQDVLAAGPDPVPAGKRTSAEAGGERAHTSE